MVFYKWYCDEGCEIRSWSADVADDRRHAFQSKRRAVAVRHEKIGNPPAQRLTGGSPVLKKSGRFIGEERDGKAVRGLGESGAAPLDVRFLARPAAEKGVQMSGGGEGEQFLLFPPGEETPGNIPVSEIVPHPFQIYTHPAVPGNGKDRFPPV